MKMNVKMFNSLTNPPAEVLEVEGKVVEIHYMNDTNYLAQYAGQGHFFAWSSDGKSYKLLVEKGYYEELNELFLPKVQSLQIKLYEDLSKARRRIYLSLILPVFLIIVGLLVVSMLMKELADYTIQIAIGGLVVFLIANIFQSSYLRRKVDKLRNQYFDDLEEFFGDTKLDELVVRQREYHARYFNFDYEEPVKEDVVHEAEVEEKEETQVVPAWVSEAKEDKVEEVKEEPKKEEAKPAETVKEEPKEVKKEEVKPKAAAKPKEKPAEKAVDPNDAVDLSVLTVDELKEFAKDRKVNGFSTMRKGELVEVLPKVYADLRVVELQALARLESIPNFSTMRKGELIDVLKNGYQEKEEPQKEEMPVVEEASERIQVVEKDGKVNLAVLTVEELKEFAKDRKVVGFSTMRKPELVESLPNNINELRLTELKAYARYHELPNFSTMRKDELIEGLTLGIPVVVEEVVEEVEEVEVINVLNEDGTANLNLLTVEELKEFVKERKVAGFSTMRKPELVAAIPNKVEDLRAVELKALARVKKVPNFSTMRKGELLEAIK
ncbi:MAG: Rho termination factor N-terminal domain-containing protein [Acholeplasmataceae bacterium]